MIEINEIEEIKDLIKKKNPKYLNRFTTISDKWQSNLQKLHSDNELVEYNKYLGATEDE